MKSNELRIGNLVYNETVKEVMEVYPMMIPQIKKCELAGEHNIKPIPLTEEWLVNFGFIKCMGRHGEYFKHKEFDAFRVWYNEELTSWSVGRKDYESIDKEYNTYWIRDNIKALHQLQNLYFCLVGEELTLNK